MKLTDNIVLSDEQLNAFPPKIGNKTKKSTFTTTMQYCVEGSSQSNKGKDI